MRALTALFILIGLFVTAPKAGAQVDQGLIDYPAGHSTSVSAQCLEDGIRILYRPANGDEVPRGVGIPSFSIPEELRQRDWSIVVPATAPFDVQYRVPGQNGRDHNFVYTVHPERCQRTTTTTVPEEDKVEICHRTASDTNPYVIIEVDRSALDTHLNNGQGHPQQGGRDDIYPVPESRICSEPETTTTTVPETSTTTVPETTTTTEPEPMVIVEVTSDCDTIMVVSDTPIDFVTLVYEDGETVDHPVAAGAQTTTIPRSTIFEIVAVEVSHGFDTISALVPRDLAACNDDPGTTTTTAPITTETTTPETTVTTVTITTNDTLPETGAKGVLGRAALVGASLALLGIVLVLSAGVRIR